MSKRHYEIVRRYLDTLPESGNSAGGKTLGDVAKEIGTTEAKLRKFRDGVDSALNNTLVTGFASLLGTGVMTTGEPSDPAMPYDPSGTGWYGTMVRRVQDREHLYDQYDVIDETRGEAASALDAWSDLMILGSVGEDCRYRGGFEPAPHH